MKYSNNDPFTMLFKPFYFHARIAELWSTEESITVKIKSLENTNKSVFFDK